MSKHDLRRVIDERPAVTVTAAGVMVMPSFTGNWLAADGSVELTGNLPVAAGVTVDGVDISELALDVQRLSGANTISTTGYTVMGHGTSLADQIPDWIDYIKVWADIFALDELVLLCTQAGQYEVMRVVSAATLTTNYAGSTCYQYSVSRRIETNPAGLNLAFTVGTLVSGLTDQGFIAFDNRYGRQRTPSMRVTMFTDTPATMEAAECIVQVGNLRGVLGMGVDQFGAAFGRLTGGDRYLVYNGATNVLLLHNSNIEVQDMAGDRVFYVDGAGTENAPGYTSIGPRASQITADPGANRVSIRVNDQEVIWFDATDGSRIAGQLGIGSPTGPQIQLGQINGEATIQARNTADKVQFLLRTDSTANAIHMHLGNPKPEPGWWEFDNGIATHDGTIRARAGEFLGRLSFGPAGEIVIGDPENSQRYGHILPQGIVGYSVSSIGEQYAAAVDAWGNLTVTYGPGQSRTWIAGEGFRGDFRYRHFRWERGPNARVGLFDGNTPKAYLDAQGNAFFNGTAYVQGGTVTGNLMVYDPSDPNRYGMITTNGIVGYAVDYLDEQYPSSVDAWSLLNVMINGENHTFLPGEGFRGDWRYRHLRWSRGTNGIIGLFDGDVGKAYLTYDGNFYGSGEVHAADDRVALGEPGRGVRISRMAFEEEPHREGMEPGGIEADEPVTSLLTYMSGSNQIWTIDTWADTVSLYPGGASYNRDVLKLKSALPVNSDGLGLLQLRNVAARESTVNLLAVGNWDDVYGTQQKAEIILFAGRHTQLGVWNHSRIIFNANTLQLEASGTAPVQGGESLPDGLFSYADGSGWDPGKGEGLYWRQNGAWHQIVGDTGLSVFGYLKDDGSTIGATSQSQKFTRGVNLVAQPGLDDPSVVEWKNGSGNQVALLRGLYTDSSFLQVDARGTAQYENAQVNVNAFGATSAAGIAKLSAYGGGSLTNPASLEVTQGATGVGVVRITNATFVPGADGVNAIVMKDASGSNTIFNIDTTNRRVGINTASPGYGLEVQASSVRFGYNYTVPNYGSAVSVIGSLGNANADALAVTAYSDNTVNGYAASYNVQHQKATTGTYRLFGQNVYLAFPGHGNVSHAGAYRTEIDLSADLDVDNVYGLYMEVSANGGMPDVLYGIYLPNLRDGAKNWAIYSAGGDSRFDGSIGIATDPGYPLDVNGTGRIASGLITPFLRPNSNSTTAVQIQKVDGTAVLNVDTTNNRVGIANSSPAQALDVTGYGKFSSGLITGAVKPSSNSTTAVQIQDASGTSVLNVDTTNSRVGIANSSPGQALDVTGYGKFSSGVIAPVLKPASDSTTAVQIQSVMGGVMLNADTTNARVGIGVTGPTAFLHVKASTTSSASLRIASGTAPTNPNDGDIWFDGTDLRIRVSGTTYKLTKST